MFRKTISKALSIVMADVMLMTAVFTASAAGLGDVTGDSAIDAVDASEILAEYARKSTNQASTLTEEQQKAADVDKNGSINAVDASQVLSFYAYKATSSGETVGFEEFLVDPPATTTKVTTTAVTTTTTTTATKVTPEAALVGSWLPEPDEGEEPDSDGEGIAFTEDGHISMFFDTSEKFIFREDGLLYNDKVYPYDMLKWDGDNVSLTEDDKTLFEMRRTEKGSGYDGKYVVYGGDMYQGMLIILLLLQTKDISAITITAEFSGDHSEMWLNNFMEYKVDGNTIEFVLPVEGDAEQKGNNKLEFTVDGDTLALTSKSDDNSEPKTVILHRVK